MTPQEAAKEEVQTNVIYMGDYLLQRKNKLVDEANTMFAKAQKLSKKENPREDPFAGVLMNRVDEIVERVNVVDRHLKFIMRGGLGAILPNSGYKMQWAQPTPPPPVKISVSRPNPIP